MPVRPESVVVDAHDPEGLSRFWAALLGRGAPVPDARGGLVLAADEEPGFALRFVPTSEPKRVPNRIHFDLTSATAEDQQATVDRALALGASHLDVGQRPEEGHVVLADPEGNELCVIEAGNRFLADTAFIGALSCDGSQDVGYFWSAVLDWPLVWDQDEETAVQSPLGGSKIAWGGPPLDPKVGKTRWHLDLVASGGVEVEVQRLLGLGATRVDIGQGDVDWEVLADPDGNEFCVVPPA